MSLFRARLEIGRLFLRKYSSEISRSFFALFILAEYFVSIFFELENSYNDSIFSYLYFLLELTKLSSDVKVKQIIVVFLHNQLRPEFHDSISFCPFWQLYRFKSRKLLLNSLCISLHEIDIVLGTLFKNDCPCDIQNFQKGCSRNLHFFSLSPYFQILW